MSAPAPHFQRHERLIAALLGYGTWIATAIITVGLVVNLFPGLDATFLPGISAHGIMKTGIVLFILLPITRVILMLTFFLRIHDHVYTAISALVLAFIAIGFLVSL